MIELIVAGTYARPTVNKEKRRDVCVCVCICVCSIDRQKGGSVYIAMLKSNFPELVLFEFRIYHVKRELNTERDVTGKFLSSGLRVSKPRSRYRRSLMVRLLSAPLMYWKRITNERTQGWVRIRTSTTATCVCDRSKMKCDEIVRNAISKKCFLLYFHQIMLRLCDY